MANVLITGASGLIGSHLTKMLLGSGHQVCVLGRSQSGAEGTVKRYSWDYRQNMMDEEALEDTDVIVHLAGAPVADKRWLAKREKEIIDSRIRTADMLFNRLERNRNKVRAIISASAVGYYGDRGDAWLNEDASPGRGFLPETCKKWEAAIQQFTTLGIRECRVRIGVVLSRSGGALPQLELPVRYGIGAYAGGMQYLPWIHIDDICGLFKHAVENEQIKGAINAVAPTPVRAKELTAAIAEELNKNVIKIPVPGILLRLIMGEMADMVLMSTRARADKILSAGYNYKFDSLKDALHDIYSHNPSN